MKGDHFGQFLTMATRDAMENNQTYAEALHQLTHAPLVGPAYIIIGGKAKGEGAVLTRDQVKCLDVWDLAPAQGNNSFYVLQTNYDHWKQVRHVNPIVVSLATSGIPKLPNSTLFSRHFSTTVVTLAGVVWTCWALAT